MRGISRILAAALCLPLLLVTVAQAKSVELYGVHFPEKRTVNLSLATTRIAPTAKITAAVTYKQGQAKIDMAYTVMKPAILFGGDVTCFVVWAVTRDGRTENLGELLTRKTSGRLSFQTGKKSFALMVTAESYYLVGQPSELVVFTNATTTSAEMVLFQFDGFAPAPKHHVDGISHLKWDSKVPLELLQARKALQLAERHEAPMHAPGIYVEADAALRHANEIAGHSPKSRELLDAARRAVTLGNEALNISMHRIEAIELEREIARRRKETAALEKRAAEAETASRRAQQLAAEAETATRQAQQLATEVLAEADRVRAEKERMVQETAALRSEKASIESSMTQLRVDKGAAEQAANRLQLDKTSLEREAARLAQDKADIEREAARLLAEKRQLEQSARQLQHERDQLSGRLEGALAHVADTTESARGYVVNLPDILFDLNEAELKPEAGLILSKLAGILLIVGNQHAVIEGHTDSTGSPEYNLDLSRRRAASVMEFMRSQGIESQRLRALGYGVDKPVADNSSADGRRRNRRVEIIIMGEAETVR